MIRLDASTVMLQWAVGGLLFCWFTVRSAEIGKGYATMLRLSFAVIAAGATVAGRLLEPMMARDVIAGSVAGIAVVGLFWRWKWIDLVAVAIGTVGLVVAGLDAGGNDTVSLLRVLIGAAFLGAVTDAMLLGHWYLVQPGMPRKLLNDLVRVVLWVLPFEIGAMLLPTGMVSVINGNIDDGWNGTLGWFWIACAIATGVLAFVTTKALKERSYSAVMAATGLMYLAILTAFGTDLVARAVLA